MLDLIREGSATDALTIPDPAASGAVALADDIETAYAFAIDAKAASTQRAYQDAWKEFCIWCLGRGITPLAATPAQVAGYLGWCASERHLSVSTICQRCAGLRHASNWRRSNPPPTSSEKVRATLSGIRRRIGSAPLHRKEPMVAERLTALMAQIPNTLIGNRDRALLTLGFAGAFRRSELVALTVADLRTVPDGIRVTIRRSKTDQEALGQEIAVPRGYRLRPVEALARLIQGARATLSV